MVGHNSQKNDGNYLKEFAVSRKATRFYANSILSIFLSLSALNTMFVTYIHQLVETLAPDVWNNLSQIVHAQSL